MIIKVKHVKEFGKNRFYPANEEEDSAKILKLMKRNSFTDEQIVECAKFGWEVILVPEEFDLKQFDKIK